jgi:hypothetical protein
MERTRKRIEKFKKRVLKRIKFDFIQLIWGFAPNPRIFKKQNYWQNH